MSKKSAWQILSITGFIGVLAYTTHVVLGGILWAGYNHITQTISELTGSGSPNAHLLSILTTIYGVLLIVFSISVFINFKDLKVRRVALIGAIFLIVMEVISFIGYGLFPLDTGSSLNSFQNIMHLVVTGIVVVCTIGSSFCIGIGLIRTKEHGKIGMIILVCAIIITIFGFLTPIIISYQLPISGLTERINIFALQTWIALLSIYLFNKSYAK